MYIRFTIMSSYVSLHDTNITLGRRISKETDIFYNIKWRIFPAHFDVSVCREGIKIATEAGPG